MNLLKKTGLSLALAIGVSSAAWALPATTAGTWGSSIVTDAVVAGEGTNKITWGTPTNILGNNPGLLPSAYIFDGIAADVPVDGSIFKLGDFTHDNETILSVGAGFQGALLTVTLSIAGDNGVFNFPFTHFETPNNADPCPAGGANPCPDRVTFSAATVTDPVTIGGFDFELVLDGFSTDGGLTFIPAFITTEAAPNSAALYGRIIPYVPPVPEPASMALLGLGVVGLGLARRRK